MIQITTNTNSLISELNEKLKDNCPDLQLTIRSFGKDTFKLCLFNNNVIASDLIINNDNGTFNILSTTVDKYQGRGYNKFLTAVSIFLADTMTKSKELFSSTDVKARIHILSEYEHRLEEDEEKFNFFVPIAENKNKAIDIINKWINNNCVKIKANDKGGGNKTRRNKQRRKNKTQTRKSKKRKTKRLYK